MAKRKPPAPVAEPTPAAPPTPSHGRPAEALYQESQRLDRPAPLTAAGTRIRQRDQLNEWIAYCMVILIFIMIGNLGERWWDMRTGRSRELPPELVAALERESAGGRMDTNPLTGAPRAPDDPARERELLDTLKQNPEDHDAMVALGNYYYDTLQVEKAIEQYTHYLEHNPDNVAVMTDLATMQFLQGMGTTVLPKDMDPNSGPVAAVATLNEAVEVDPTYAPAWQNLGWAYRQIGRTQEAINAYTKALEHTADAETRHGLEMLLQELSGKAQAPAGAPGAEPELNPLTGTPVAPKNPEQEALLQSAIKDNPSDPRPHLELGHYYYDTFQPELAIREYETYFQLGGERTPAARTDYATVLSRVDMPRALRELDQITKDHPDFFAAWVNLATLRLESGDKAGGIEALRGAIAIATEQDKPFLQEKLRALTGE